MKREQWQQCNTAANNRLRVRSERNRCAFAVTSQLSQRDKKIKDLEKELEKCERENKKVGRADSRVRRASGKK